MKRGSECIIPEEEEEDDVEEEEKDLYLYPREVRQFLLRAVSSGDFRTLISVINKYPNYIETSMIDLISEGNTLLYFASGIGFINVVEELLARGADLHKANEDGCTPLFSAARNGHVSLVVFFLDHGANVNQLSNNGLSALHFAAALGYIDVVKVLLERGADVNHVTNSGDTPLYKAVCLSQVPVVKLLLDHGAHVNHVVDGMTSLLKASDSGNLPMVEILLEFGADVDMEFQNSSSRLLSNLKGHFDVTRRLESVEYTRSKARSQCIPFFKYFIKGGIHPGPLRQWIPLLLPEAREALSLWVNASIADEVSCYAAFFQGPSTGSLRRLTNHQGVLSHALIELLVRRSPATRQLLREVSIYLRGPNISF